MDVNTLVRTRAGDKKISDVAVGDVLYGVDGHPVLCLDVSPVQQGPMVEVTYNEFGSLVKTSFKCSRNHPIPLKIVGSPIIRQRGRKITWFSRCDKQEVVREAATVQRINVVEDLGQKLYRTLAESKFELPTLDDVQAYVDTVLNSHFNYGVHMEHSSDIDVALQSLYGVISPNEPEGFRSELREVVTGWHYAMLDDAPDEPDSDDVPFNEEQFESQTTAGGSFHGSLDAPSQDSQNTTASFASTTTSELGLDPDLERRFARTKDELEARTCPCAGFHQVSRSMRSEDEADVLIGVLRGPHYHVVDPWVVRHGDDFPMTAAQFSALCTTMAHDRFLKIVRGPLIIDAVQSSSLPIHPYYLGMWLGDGIKRTTGICSSDVETKVWLQNYVDDLNVFRPSGKRPLKLSEFLNARAGTLKYMAREDKFVNCTMDNYTYTIVQDYSQPSETWNPVRSGLKDLGLLDDKSGGIPDVYLNASLEERLQVVAGMIDTDGYYDPTTNQYVFLQAGEEHRQMVDDLRELVMRCGIDCSVVNMFWSDVYQNFRYRVSFGKGADQLQPYLMLQRKKMDLARTFYDRDGRLITVLDVVQGSYRQIQVNPEYLSVNWESGGGGAFAVIPLNEKGKVPDVIPLFRGHTAVVLDTDWHPFNDRIIASGSDDGKIFIWEVPRDFTLFTDAEEPADVTPVSKLAGHSRKVGQVLFNPAAENILASASGDFTIKLWDISTGQSQLALKHADIVQSLSWNATGNLMVTTSRDKKLRVWDVRQEKPAHVGPGHEGAKNSRAVWMGEHNRIATTGFSRMSDRQLALWEPGSDKPIGGFNNLDSISGVCMPFWDDSTNCLYLAGKGDGNIRYFEYENDKFEFLSEYKSGDPQRGIAFMPKRGVNLHENEVMRAYKTVNDLYIEPISFTVPRRAETFQSDIFPPCTGSKPAMSASEWYSGKTALPSKIDLESKYEGNAPVEVAADYKPPAAAPAPTPAPAAKPAPKPEPEPVQARAAPPSVAQQKGSMAAAASKFQDDEDDKESEGETSSFEEVQKPVSRAALPVRSEPPKAQAPAQAKAPSPIKSNAPFAASSSSAARSPQPSPALSQSGSGSGNVEASLEQIKQLIEAQTRVIAAQGDKITAQGDAMAHLTGEVETLKKRVVSGSQAQDQSERIRQLELELEEARS